MKNIVLSFHSSLQSKAIKINNYLSKNMLKITEITEINPEDLSIRCKFIKVADAFLVLTSPSYQKSVPCMELINYAKDAKKTIYALNIFDNYTPFGGLGAISAGSSLGLINIKDLEKEENVFYGLNKIIQDLDINESSSTKKENESRPSSTDKINETKSSSTKKVNESNSFSTRKINKNESSNANKIINKNESSSKNIVNITELSSVKKVNANELSSTKKLNETESSSTKKVNESESSSTKKINKNELSNTKKLTKIEPSNTNKVIKNQSPRTKKETESSITQIVNETKSPSSKKVNENESSIKSKVNINISSCTKKITENKSFSTKKIIINESSSLKNFTENESSSTKNDNENESSNTNKIINKKEASSKKKVHITESSRMKKVNAKEPSSKKKGNEKELSATKKPNDDKTSYKTSINSNQNPFEYNNSLYPVVNLKYIENNSNVLISFNSIKCQEVLNIIQEALTLRNISYVTEDSSGCETSVKTVKIVLIIMTEEYENSYNSKTIIEAARLFNKSIIPVCTTTTWKPEHWLGLIIAGKLFYSILNKEQAYCSKNYSTPINELVKAILVANEPVLSENEKEKVTIESLNLQIEKCKVKLGKWPPSKHKLREIIERKQVKVTLSEPCATNQYNFIHYEVMELSFVPPRQLFDNHGIPIKQRFDCMISYQWNFQDLVRAIYCDLHMANISIWFDISGGMVGNLNDAMATAIQSSKVVIVFLSDSYQKSINCKLEFCYAVALNKAFIFVLVEHKLLVADWIEPYFNESPKFDIKDINEMGILHKGVPRIFCLQHAVREIGNAQPDCDDYELTEEIIDLKTQLNYALDEIAELESLERFKKCSRCNKNFDETCLTGCKKHSAYYVGGTLIEGRWVCCNQQSKEAFGCCNVDHICVNRKWIIDNNYGVYYYDTDYIK